MLFMDVVPPNDVLEKTSTVSPVAIILLVVVTLIVGFVLFKILKKDKKEV